MKTLNLILALIAFLMCGQVAASEETPGSDWSIKQWNFATSIYTKHFDPEPDHNDSQNLIGVEMVFENDWIAGIAVFDNSFDQPSQLVFIGKTWPILSSPYWYFKLMGGLLHGYKEPYEDKIPFNGLGVAPAIVPALGLRYKRVYTEVNLAGAAAVTVNVGFSF
jgi:hypothetical protein